MFQLIRLTILVIYLLPLNVQADSPGKQKLHLELNCTTSFNNFDNIENAVTSSQVTLTAAKHQPGGMQLVTQTSTYEFWVMAHGVQTINRQKFINNFQVAIKHKDSQLFMHALSDTSHTPDIPPKHARISLVDYHPDSTLEKGELLFECRRIE